MKIMTSIERVDLKHFVKSPRLNAREADHAQVRRE